MYAHKYEFHLMILIVLRAYSDSQPLTVLIAMILLPNEHFITNLVGLCYYDSDESQHGCDQLLALLYF